MTLPSPAAPPERRSVPWATRLLAVLGFVLAGGVGAIYTSQQMAVEKARGYLKSRFKTNLEVPVKSIRPDFVFDPSSGRPAPPLGFCWTIEIDTGVGSGEVMVNPWNHEVVDWSVSEL
jgi:hypothetical protein